MILLYGSRTWSKIPLWVFRINPAFNGPASWFKRTQRTVHLTRCQPDLFFNQVQSHCHLSDGMFYLDAGIHLHKIEIFVSVHQKFHSACIKIVNSTGSGHCGIPHLFTQSRGKKGRRRFFNKLLKTSLNSTLPLPQVNRIAISVREDLKFNMPRISDKFFHIQLTVSKRSTYLHSRDGKFFRQGIRILTNSDPASPSPSR